jgi:hypothetical protein
MTELENAVWWTYMDRVVTHVLLEFQEEEDEFGVYFLVKPEFGEKWMSRYSSEYRLPTEWRDCIGWVEHDARVARAMKRKWAEDYGLGFDLNALCGMCGFLTDGDEGDVIGPEDIKIVTGLPDVRKPKTSRMPANSEGGPEAQDVKTMH